MWNITRAHFVGFLAGVGASAVGFYLYKKNQTQVDEFLRCQGIQIPGSRVSEASMTLEELVREKERFEDLIAEREHVTA